MNKKFLLTLVIFFSTQGLISSSAYAVTTLVEVGEVMSWEVSGFSANDVTYPNTVYFTLEFHNNGTVDMNVSGNLSVKKGVSAIYTSQVFDGNVSASQYRNFTFNWIPTDTGDFLANVTINMTNNQLNQTNLTFAVTSFTVYSQPSQPPPETPSSPPRSPVLNITKTWDEILPGAAVTIKIDNTQIAFTEITIEVNKESSKVKVEVNKIKERPGSVRKDPPGKTYQYMEVKHENLEENLEKATINFRVENQWVSDNNIDKSTVTLNRYSSVTEEWESLFTTFLSEDSNYAHYSADVTSLSIFSVTGKEKTICTPSERRCVGSDLRECSSEGSWQTLETCEFGCEGGKCIEIPTTLCSPDEERCLGNFLQKCSGDGSEWETIEACKYGCWDNECKGMVVSYVTRMAVFVLFAILVAIVVIMVTLVYMNLKNFLARKK